MLSPCLAGRRGERAPTSARSPRTRMDPAAIRSASWPGSTSPTTSSTRSGRLTSRRATEPLPPPTDAGGRSSKRASRQIVYLGGWPDQLTPALSAPPAQPTPRPRTCSTSGSRAGHDAPGRDGGRPGSAAFETIVALVDRLPAMISPALGATPTQPIALGDVVATWRLRPRGRLGASLRRRRTGGDDLPGDDRARSPACAAGPAHLRGARAVRRRVLLSARARHARAVARRAAARRGPPQPDRGARRARRRASCRSS